MRSSEAARMPRGVAALIAASLLACAVQIVGGAIGWSWAGNVQWFAMPPLALALVLAGGLRDRRGRWWLAGILLSWAGDTLGGQGFIVLLGFFLLAHLCYLAALWPTRRDSVLGTRAMVPYLLLGAGGAAVIAPAAGVVLAGPVVVYAAALTLMAILASAAGRAGLLGGVLFMLSDLTLALDRFVIDLPEPLETALVMGTYVPAQALLLVALLTLMTRAAPAARTQRTDQPDPDRSSS